MKVSRNTKTIITALLTGVSIATVAASSAWAQQAPQEDGATRTYDEIVVTARFREETVQDIGGSCLLYTSPSPRDATLSRMPSSA